MSSSSHKKRRMNKSSRQSSISMVDRISDLPDSILCHILYSLPTKFGATTSVLSKRWRYLWLSVLALDFDSRDFKNSTLFCRVMYSTMSRRAITLPIHSFSLKDRKKSCNQKVVNKVVGYVLQRGIKNFDLNLSNYSRYLINLPVTILSCRTLKVLKLTNITVDSIPNEVDLYLPSLKTLHLNKVYFERYRDLVSLVLSCPILEDFETTSCIVSGLVNPCVNLTVIPNLIKARISELYIPLFAVSKAKILRIEEMRMCMSNDRLSQNLKPMLTCCMQLPKFQNLTHLELNFGSTLLYPRWTWLLGMLELSPKLQNLIIQDNDALEETNDECWQNPSIIPACLLLRLKTCRIRDYKGKKYDLKFAKYIIKNSKVLNTMTINSTCSLNPKAKHRLYKKLSSFQRGSPTYKLLFD